MNNEAITRAANKVWLSLKKHSPEILLGFGIAGGITGAVMACRATTKLDEVLKDAKFEICTIKHEMEVREHADVYSEEDAKKDLALVYSKAALDVAKLYAPSLAVGGFSITCILSSHNIMSKRNVALSAAYDLASASFKDYRNRVVNRFGEQVDKELRYNTVSEKVEETTTDENGKTKKVKSVVEISEPDGYRTFFFDELSPSYTKDRDYNLMWLKSQQAFMNDKLRAKGYVFLNEVKEMLGYPPSKDGQMAGWIWDPYDATKQDVIDFGIIQTGRQGEDSVEPAILLAFDGIRDNIWGFVF